MPFAALGLGPKITRSVTQAGYTEPTPIQSKAIPIVLQQKDLIGIAQTGTGKTAAFVLPILEMLSTHGSRSGRRGIRALVVAPTRELVVQIEENARKYGANLHIKIATVYGGVGERPQIAALRGGAELIIATPGRLMDLMRQGHVKFADLEILVLDEADRMLDMGFLPQIREIVRAVPSDRQTLLFSASLSREIEQISSEFLRKPEIVQIGRRANPAESVAQFVYEIPHSRKYALLQHLLLDHKLDSVLVFTRTKHGADKIAKRLAASGVTTATLHSNRSQAQRMQALRGFKSGIYRVLVATDIAARGIDVEGISHVINFDFPPQPEDYVHRIGRTGRARAVGDAISFVTPDDRANLRALEKFIGRGIPRVTPEKFDMRDVPEERHSLGAPSQRPHRNEAPRRFERRDERRPFSDSRGERSSSSRPAGGQSRGPRRPQATFQRQSESPAGGSSFRSRAPRSRRRP